MTLPLRKLRPFRLIAILPSERRVTEWRWNLEWLTTPDHKWQLQHWFSSAFDERRAELERKCVCTQRKMANRPETSDGCSNCIVRTRRKVGHSRSVCIVLMRRPSATQRSLFPERPSATQRSLFPDSARRCAINPGLAVPMERWSRERFRSRVDCKLAYAIATNRSTAMQDITRSVFLPVVIGTPRQGRLTEPAANFVFAKYQNAAISKRN